MLTTTLKSENKKLYGKPGSPKWAGLPIAATSRKIGAQEGGTCPTTCRFLPKDQGGNGACYAAGGPQGFVHRRSGYDASDGGAYANFVKSLPQGYWIRLHVSGDFALNGAPDWDYIRKVKNAHAERPDLTAWAYTHLWREMSAQTFADTNLTVRASCETPQEVEEAKRLGWQTVMVGRSDETRRAWRDGETRYALCPEVAVGTACRYCGLCAKDNDLTIVFPAHGQSKKRVDILLDTIQPLPVAGD